MYIYVHVYYVSLYFLQDVQISFCTSEKVVEFDIAALVYSSTLLVILFILTFLTLRSTVSLSAFHREGRLSFVALAMILVPVPILTVLLAIAMTEEAFDDDTCAFIVGGVCSWSAVSSAYHDDSLSTQCKHKKF